MCQRGNNLHRTYKCHMYWSAMLILGEDSSIAEKGHTNTQRRVGGEREVNRTSDLHHETVIEPIMT